MGSGWKAKRQLIRAQGFQNAHSNQRRKRWKFVAVQVIGKLVKADYEHFVPELDRLIRQHGKLRLLFEHAQISMGGSWRAVGVRLC